MSGLVILRRSALYKLYPDAAEKMVIQICLGLDHRLNFFFGSNMWVMHINYYGFLIMMINRVNFSFRIYF